MSENHLTFTRHLQGGILSHHGRKCCTYYCIKLKQTNQNKILRDKGILFLKELSKLVTSQEKQTEDALIYKRIRKEFDNKKNYKECVFVNLGMNYTAFINLGIDSKMTPDDQIWKGGLRSIQDDGMFYSYFNNCKVTDDAEFLNEENVDILLTIAHTNRNKVRDKINEITKIYNFEQVVDHKLTTQIDAMKNMVDGVGLGPLGFSDGRANPKSLSEKIRVSLVEEKKTIGQVGDNGPKPTLYGSYGAFIKILVYQENFKCLVNEIVKAGSPELQPEQVEAMLMGRYRKGALASMANCDISPALFSVSGEDHYEEFDETGVK